MLQLACAQAALTRVLSGVSLPSSGHPYEGLSLTQAMILLWNVCHALHAWEAPADECCLNGKVTSKFQLIGASHWEAMCRVCGNNG